MKFFTTALIASAGTFIANCALAATHYVSLSSANPVAPFSDWSTAATNIQDAIDASTNGDLVLVTNGTYSTGGISMDGLITNRVTLNKVVTVQSVNGLDSTIIQGAWDPVSTNGQAAIRCAWITNNAILSGFTLRGGATRSSSSQVTAALLGGGVFGTQASRSGPTNSTVSNCLIEGNYAGFEGGGAYLVALTNCTLKDNHIPRSLPTGGGGGGGAAACIMKNCLVISNSADQTSGGGAESCNIRNCAFFENSADFYGGAAHNGSLINCTIVSNISSGYSPAYGGAVYGATLFNCIVFGNLSRTTYPNTNYASCSLSYCCADPLPTGAHNIDVNPQVLADGIHLAAGSPCIGAGEAQLASGTDIDGEPWNNPPAIGCAEYIPAPLVVIQPTFQINSPANSLKISVNAAGAGDLTYVWTFDGSSIQDDGHYTNSGTPSLLLNNFGPSDSGSYQVVISNSYGTVTSQVVQLNIHGVDANGINPTPPYLTWATAATNIQDAINAASDGEIILVTNGVYNTGGRSVGGTLTNRVTIDKALTVLSVNGFSATTIQGALDPQTTTGPLSVRCAWMTNGAVLEGFTLRDGSTLSGGVGGGVWCSASNAIVANCVLTNNFANQGGGIAYGTINNSFLILNAATSAGQAAFNATLNQCTVEGAVAGIAYETPAGTYQCLVRNSIVQGYQNNFSSGPSDTYEYSFTVNAEFGTMPFNGVSNINASLFSSQIFDGYHIEATSPCRGAGNPLYSTGTDLDGEPWANPPSMGCDEFVAANRTGPLFVSISGYETNPVINDFAAYFANINGTAATLSWSYSDGTNITTLTNVGSTTSHTWTNAGNQSVTVTAYNESNPDGVSATLPIIVYASPITNAPEYVTAYVDGNVTFDTITPIPWWAPPYSLQWYLNGVALTNSSHYAGTHSGALTISNLQSSDAGNYYLLASNFDGFGSNLVDVLSVQSLPPLITPGEPASASVYIGGSMSLTATAAAGTPPLYYQWYDGTAALQDTNEFSGSTSPTLTINPAVYADAGGYTLVISNAEGSVTSQVATVTVLAPPPPSYVAYGNAGSNYFQTFDSLPYQPTNSVAAADPVNINGAVYSLGNPFDFAFVAETSGAGGLGLFNAMDGWYGSGSAAAYFGASAGDQTNGGVLSFGSTNDTISAANRSLGLLATGNTGPTAFGVRFVNTTGHTLGQFNLSYMSELWRQAATSKTVTNYYYVDATGTNGFLTNIVGGSLTSLSFAPGDPAWGTNGPLASNSVSLTGQTFTTNWPAGAALWVVWEMSDSEEGGQGIGIDNLSFSASLAGNLAPVITTEPQSQTVTNGLPASFSVAVSNLLSGGYEWFTNGVPLTDTNEFSGSTNATLAINPAGFSDATSYWVIVSNAYGSATSVPVTLTVTAAITAPGFVTQPQSQTNFIGSNVLFGVTPSGTQPILYQWQFDGTNVSGATDATLELTNLAYANAGTYMLVLSNSAGTNISQPATLTVVAAPPVQVNLTPQAGNVVLQWPGSGGTNLLVTPDLTQPWAPAGLPVASSNFINSVTIPIGAASQFFRLLQ